MSLIMSFEDNGCFMSNIAISKALGWNDRKIQRVISSLLDKKRIMIWRKTLNSHERRINLYNRKTIEMYEDGFFSDRFVLDYKK